MRNHLLAAVLSVCALLTGAAHAKESLECYINPATRAATCIDTSKVTANGDLRASPIYMGGAKEVRPTSYTMVANCKRDVVTLQDRQGVNFAGDRGGATEAVKALSLWLCRVTKTRQDKTLQQFGG